MDTGSTGLLRGGNVVDRLGAGVTIRARLVQWLGEVVGLGIDECEVFLRELVVVRLSRTSPSAGVSCNQ